MRKTSDHTPQQLQEAEALYMENENLIYFVLNRFFYDKRLDEDIQQIGRIGLWRACLSFNHTVKNKFSTYACKCIGNEILKQIRTDMTQKRNGPTPISLNAPVATKARDSGTLTVGDLIPGSPDVDFVDLSGLFDGLTRCERQATCLMAAGFTAEEAASMIGCTKRSVTQMAYIGRQKIRHNAGRAKRIPG